MYYFICNYCSCFSSHQLLPVPAPNIKSVAPGTLPIVAVLVVELVTRFTLTTVVMIVVHNVPTIILIHVEMGLPAKLDSIIIY